MDLMKLTTAGLGKNATPQTMIQAYNDCVIGEKRSAWKTAVVVYKTVRHERFKEFFKSIEEYSNQIGFTKSYVSKQVRAVECYGELMKVDTAFEHVSVGFVSELLLIEKEITSDVLTDFIQTMGLECTDTRDVVRAKVKDYKNIINGGGNALIENENTGNVVDENIEFDDTEDMNDNECIMNENYVITSNDIGSVVITNPDLKNALLELLREYGYEV